MDGIINFYKPIGITSAKALYRVRKATQQKKSGHAGTLDPMAEGVLLLCQGKGTKLVEKLMDQPKIYRGIARLDVTSESYDADREMKPVTVEAPPEKSALLAVAQSLEGTIMQTPPVISAIKVGGQPAYKLNRKGKPPKLDPRPVNVYWLEILDYDWPNVTFEVACGRGTYVRSLIRDIGEKLSTGGCLTALTRVSIGPFHMDAGWSFERIEALENPEDALCPLEEAKALLEQPIVIPERPKH